MEKLKSNPIVTTVLQKGLVKINGVSFSWLTDMPDLSSISNKYRSFFLSETLILASINPEYDKRSFVELQVQYIV